MIQANLPKKYWNILWNMLQNQKNMITHSTTQKTLYETLYGEHLNYLHHIPPFCCKMIYHPAVDRKPTFNALLRDGIYIGNDGGRV